MKRVLTLGAVMVLLLIMPILSADHVVSESPVIFYYNWEAERFETQTFAEPEYTQRLPEPDCWQRILELYNHVLCDGRTADEVTIHPLEVNTFKRMRDCLYVDFAPGIYQNKFGIQYEKFILDGLIYSLFRNDPQLRYIYISVEKSDYETGHYLFEQDEVYMDRDCLARYTSL